MKRIYLSILITGLSLLLYSQDKVYVQADFSTFPPTGWSVVNGSGSSGNWAKTCYPIVRGDVVAQNERLISPAIICSNGATDQFRVSFKYMASATAANENVYLLMSTDAGLTWALAPYTTNIWNKTASFPGTANYWYSQGTIDISTAAKGNTIKLAFIYRTTASVPFGYFAVDNFLVEKSTDAGVTWSPWSDSKFESGIATEGWTLQNTPAPGSSQHFTDHYLALVKDDPTNAQNERLKTPDIIFSDNALATLNFSIDWWSTLNTAANGVRLYASTDHGTTFGLISDVSLSSSTVSSVQQYSFNLSNAYKGDTVMFALDFTDPAASSGDFFLDSLKIHQVFNTGGVGADAYITLGTQDTMIYPVLDKYKAVSPNGIKEGFWQVAPESWILTKTAKATWGRATSIGTPTHDYAAHIDTIGANKATMDETLTSQTIALKYPPVGASYDLSFEWRTNTDRNCGLNTNPDLGTGVKYDFADVIVEIRTHDGTSWSAWTKIWQEDDATILGATTSKATSSYFYPWVSFQNYLDNPGRWYKATLNITQYTTNKKNIEVRFNYKGNGAQAGYFSLDNFYILRNQNPQFVLETAVPVSVSNAYHIDYTYIPLSQIVNPVKLGARLTNYGITNFTDANLTYTVFDGTTTKTYGYKTVKKTDFTTYPSTKYQEADQRAVEFTNGINLVSNKQYTVTASGTINSNSLTSSQTFNIDPKLYTKYDSWTNDSTSGGFGSGADTISGGRGSLFEMKVKDKISKVSVFLQTGTAGSEFYMTVIKLADPSSTSGTLVYTSPRKVITSGNTYEFNPDLTLNPGFYAFMFNQTDKNPLVFGVDVSNRKGKIPRGNASKIYYDSKETCELLVTIEVATNTAPVITTTFTNNKQVAVAGQAVSIKLAATDADKDSLSWPKSLRVISPTWLGAWMTFTDGGDGTITIGGTPTSAQLGTTNVKLFVRDARGATANYTFDVEVLSETAFSTPDFIEPFTFSNGSIPNLWITKDDDAKTGSVYPWRALSNTAHVYGDGSHDQDEWLISPPIYIPQTTATSDTAYRLEFDWKVYDFNYFCGGITGVLGSTKIVNSTTTYNYADVSLLVSTDQGATWSDPIWKEDSPELVAPVTKGIFGGKNWIYNNDYFYTSKINLAAYIGKKVMFAFRYQSKNAYYTQNEFTLDNFKVLINNKVDISVYAQTDYRYIPGNHVDMTKGLTFNAFIENKGWSIPAGAKYTIQCSEKGYSYTGNLDDAFFATGNVQKVSYTFIPDTGVYKDYRFDVKVVADNNTTSGLTSHTVRTYMTQQEYSKMLSTSREIKTLGAYDGIGVVYELTQTDDLYFITTYFGSGLISSTPYSISIIKLAAKGATTGELIATIDDSFGTPLTADPSGYYNNYLQNDNDIKKVLRLTPGFYAVVINQLDATKPIVFYCSDNVYDSKDFVRGNPNKLYNESDDRGSIYSEIYFTSNLSPYFVTNTVTDESIYTGQLFTRKIQVKDDSPYGTISLKALMKPSWLTLTANGGGSFTLSGTPTSGVTGTNNIALQASDGFNLVNKTIIITVKASMVPDFIEPFTGSSGIVPLSWITRDDYAKTSSNYFWRLNSNTANVFGDGSHEQDEWLISPPVSIPKTAASSDTVYRLEFDWMVGNFNYFCGGVKDLLGSSKLVGGVYGYNFADVSLMVSTDMGVTWSTPIWREDSPDLVAPVTKGIFGGKNFTYNGGQFYTSVINLSAYTGKKVMFAFRYQSKSADYSWNQFTLDNFKVIINNPVDLSVYARTAYQDIPGQHVDMSKGITFDAFIENKGRKILPGATYTVECPEKGYKLTGNLNAAFFATGKVQKVSYTVIPDTGVYKTYNYTVKVVADSNLTTGLKSHGISTNVAPIKFSKILSTARQVKTQGASDGLGTVFELTQTDDLLYVYTYFGGNTLSSTPYSISIVKLASKTATTGEVIATIDDNGGTKFSANGNNQKSDYVANDADLGGKPLRLKPGFYAVMINQLDELKPVYIYCTDNTYDSQEFVRGNSKKLYNESDDRGSIYSYIVMKDNTAPKFTVSNVRDEIIYVGQAFTRKIQVTDDNPYGTITLKALSLPSWLTLTANGNGMFTISGTPTNTAIGVQNVLLQASDGFNKTDDLATADDQDGLILLTVKPNPAPVFTSTPPTEAHQGVAFTYTALATDVFNEAVTITAPLLPTWLTAAPTAGSLKLTGTPGATNLGSNVVKLLATDASGMTSQQIFDVNVFANATPVFLSSPGLTANAGTVYTYLILCNDDNAGSVMTIAADVALPAWLTLTATGNGKATLTGTPTAAGKVDITLSVTDALGAKSTQSFSIVVSSNAAPVFTSTAVVAGTKGTLYVYNVTATDADGNSLTFATPGLPNWLTFTVTGNGKAKLQGVPTQSYVGNNLVTIKVSDGNNTTTQSFTIVVADNTSPVIVVAETGNVNEGETVSLPITATDLENDMLSFSAKSPEWLTLVDNNNGTALLKGTPPNGFTGVVDVIISVTDGINITEQAVVLNIKGAPVVSEITVTGVTLYPNPAKGKFTIANAAGSRVLVLNSAGIVIKQIENAIVNQEIDLSHYASGTYIVRIISKDNVVITKQITLIN